MKFKLIALSLCMIASANVVKGQETDGNIFFHGDKWKYPAITKPGEMLSPCGLKPLLKMTSGAITSWKATETATE